ncbi:unnamed protein product [Nesidiocoris tenuis]|uniref:Carboxylesterase type B domain-containing protein n=1 Tax=Nesidiocoris tenuis TaxID=355587 RepID=A0A6H5H639_9HEMI|nr:unnamed protein product [Nesidiocoris tenuis]
MATLFITAATRAESKTSVTIGSYSIHEALQISLSREMNNYSVSYADRDLPTVQLTPIKNASSPIISFWKSKEEKAIVAQIYSLLCRLQRQAMGSAWCFVCCAIVLPALWVGRVEASKAGMYEGYMMTSTENRTFLAFSGIRYAKPPIGELRFKPPVPIEPLTEVQKAFEEGSPCIQINALDFSNPNKITGDEDCLFLNIYTHDNRFAYSWSTEYNMLTALSAEKNLNMPRGFSTDIMVCEAVTDAEWASPVHIEIERHAGTKYAYIFDYSGTKDIYDLLGTQDFRFGLVVHLPAYFFQNLGTERKREEMGKTAICHSPGRHSPACSGWRSKCDPQISCTIRKLRPVISLGDNHLQLCRFRTAVSRATSKLYEDIIKWRPDGDRHPPEWFSTKQCAAQYEHMLKTLSSRRKKRSERGGDQSSTSDSPADTLFQICYQESPTLSKLLESSCPAGTPPNSTTSSSQLHLLHQSNPSAAHRPLQSPQAKQPHHRTSTMALSTALADHCLVAPDFHQIATSVPSAPHVPDDSKSLTSPQIEIATELVTKDAPQTLLSKGIAGEPKEAVLVNDDDIVRKLDQLMDQVQNTLAENAVDEKSANDVLAVDESKVASSRLDTEIKTTASEAPTIETLDSTSSAVGLIVMGSGRPDGSLIQPSISGPDILSYGPSVEASLEAEQANDDNLLKSSRIDQTQLPAEIQVDEKISTVLSKEFPLTQYEMEGSRSEQTGLKRTLEVSNDSTVVSQSAGADDSIAGQVREALWPIEKTSTNDGTISPTLEKDPHLGAPSTESSKLIEKQIDGTVNELQDVDGSSFNAVEDDNIDQNDAGSHGQKKFLEENQTDLPKDNDSEKLEPNCHEDQTLDGATEVKACSDSIATENGKLKDSTGPTADHGKGDDAAEKLLVNSEHKGDTLSEKLTESKKQQTLEPERAEGSRTEQADGKQGDAVTVTDSLAPSNKRSEDTSSSPEESLAAKGSEDSDSTSSSLDKSFIIQNQPVVFVERTAVTEQKSSPSISPVETLPSSIESPKEILPDEKAPTPTNFSDDQVLGARTVSKQETFFQSEKNSDLTTVPGLSFEETEKKIRQVESDKDESTQGTKDETDDVNSVPESHFDDEEDTQDHDYIPPRVPAIEPDDVTVSTETTSDSYGDKLSLAEESEFSGEEKVDESESFPKTKRRKLSVDRKQRAATTEKSLLKTLTMVQALGSGVPLDQLESSPATTARVSRASTSGKGGTNTSDSIVLPPIKRKRPTTSDTSSRLKRKRSDAS